MILMLWKMISYFSKGLFSDHTSGPQEVAAVLNFSTKKSLSSFLCPKMFSMWCPGVDIQSVPKNAFSECCWSQSALAQSPFAGTPCVWRLFFLSFRTVRLSRIKRPQVMSMVKFSRIYSILVMILF